MNDKELWELCVSSGFTESEWWPKKPDDKYELALHPEHGWLWMCSPFSSGCCEPENARARILMALVEWGRQTLQNWQYVWHSNGVDVHAAWTGSAGSRLGMGSDLTTALLDCYRQWRAAQ